MTRGMFLIKSIINYTKLRFQCFIPPPVVNHYDAYLSVQSHPPWPQTLPCSQGSVHFSSAACLCRACSCSGRTPASSSWTRSSSACASSWCAPEGICTRSSCRNTSRRRCFFFFAESDDSRWSGIASSFAVFFDQLSDLRLTIGRCRLL